MLLAQTTTTTNHNTSRIASMHAVRVPLQEAKVVSKAARASVPKALEEGSVVEFGNLVCELDKRVAVDDFRCGRLHAFGGACVLGEGMQAGSCAARRNACLKSIL
jgi:hypothetical protein